MSRPASTSTRPGASPLPRPYQVNTQTKVLDSQHGRILCIADIRGRLSALNDLAREANAHAVIHTGDFGFFEEESLQRINDRTLRHLTMYSPLIPAAQRQHLLAPENSASTIRQTVNINLLSEFPLLLSGQIKLQVPVYTVWGACEDVAVLEKVRAGHVSVENLHVLDEATTRLLDVGGVKLRLLGLGGAHVPHKMFDNGEGNATIAGGQGTMWTTALQIGELVDTAQRVFDQSETRLLVTHASPGREGIMAQLALVLKADLTISAGLHFRYATSYNEFSVQPDFEGFRHKLQAGKESFERVWETVKNQVELVIDEHQRVLLEKALSVIERIPPPQPPAGDEPSWKNCWNWNLCDAAFGALTLDIREGRVSAELKSQGFNYAYRRTATTAATPASPHPQNTVTTNASSQAPTKGPTPVPPANDRQLPPHLKSTGPTPNPASPAPDANKKDEAGSASAKAEGSTKPTTPAPNGNTAATSPVPSAAGGDGKPEKSKNQKKKEKLEQKKAAQAEREKAEGVGKPDAAKSDAGAGASAGAGAKPDAPKSDAGDNKNDTPGATLSAASPIPDDDQLKSPSESTGARTPKSGRPPRNPWTIFWRSMVGAGEEEVREFFGPARGGITKVAYPPTATGRAQKIIYIEFGDEEAMKAGLERNGEKLKDGTIPELKQASDNRDSGPGGRGRGRGGRGGGFMQRGFAAAGLAPGGGRGRGGKE
ncbi:hypothetical protein K523DRAFT_309641 [Schizophyllum commune Tattone D]|nr:hypothetical protein K523DRAFT_309641 [Schizophyllum commune Tattone D]